MSLPQTKAEWQAAAEALARLRAGRSPDLFPHALGLDPEGLHDWCADDAMDTLADLPVGHANGLVCLPAPVIGALLATHMQIGIELGVWLAEQQNGA